MADERAVWGIDIGQAGLKAIRLRYAEAAHQVVALAYDYVPHPKSLSQPDAIPEELIPEALEKFLSRNEIEGDKLAISVPGKDALARFIQLPPVESSKVAEIVKYEARQQIPFALEDVIWDYQTLGGGIEESGFMLEAEVGLFAMKRDQIMQSLRPFADSKVEVELIQIAPLALYNVLTYDQLGIGPDDEDAAQEEYTILLDMGSDDTTLLVSNGEKIWIRNVPLGGSHFTRALTKEMKLTFAKAEHLKCNATKSPDPRAVFQALRPVFSDYVAEIQRSIGYFSSVNRDAKISKVIGLGNGFKLAGLQKFLQQNLQYEVKRVDSYESMVGDNVLNAPLFEENVLTFAVPYGLALQAMGLTRMRTSLLPPEIATARKIRRKKPLATLTAAILLFGLAVSAVGYGNTSRSVSKDRFGKSEAEMTKLEKDVNALTGGYRNQVNQYKGIEEKGALLTESLATRTDWLELYKAINVCLPRDQGEDLDIENIVKMQRIDILSITAERRGDFTESFNKIPVQFRSVMLDEEQKGPPAGAGYLITLKGIHYHHEHDNPLKGQGFLYVNNTLLQSLQQWTVQHEGSAPVPVRQMGISHAAITSHKSVDKDIYPDGRRVSLQLAARARKGFRPTGRGGPRFNNNRLPEKAPEVIPLKVTTFDMQFVWIHIPIDERSAEPQEVKIAEKKPAKPPGRGRGR
jgi:type IV pilus assembly protein PilM